MCVCETKQVGDGGADHSYWGPPELMTMPRPSFKITASKPGSDIAMDTAAAFVTGYFAFKEKGKRLYEHLLKSGNWMINLNHGVTYYLW